MARKDPLWWEQASKPMKAMIAAAGVVASISGASFVWGLVGRDIIEIPGRVTRLEAQQVESRRDKEVFERSLEAKVDSVGDDVRQVREILLDWTCEQTRSSAQCREERLLRP